MTAQSQRDLAEDQIAAQMTAQLPCFEYYSAPRDQVEAAPHVAPAPGIAVLEQMFGYFG